MTADEKQSLRSACLQRLRDLPEEHRREESAAITQHLVQDARFQEARVVYGFAPLASEPAWWKAWTGNGKVWAFPRCEGDHLRFIVIRDPGDMGRGRWGNLEPQGDEPAPPPDLILVPGVAFDGCGHRLGRGRGYYDRFLAGSLGYRLGLAFHCQMVGRVPVESGDIPMDGLLTAAGWEDANGGKWPARS